ncbi:MAG: YqaA family protein [Methyloligellaceae bacterium]
MLRRLYDRVMALSAHPRAIWVLAAVAFAESSVFPIPPHALLVPMVLAERARAWSYAAITTISSVLGGVLGYGIGYFLYEAVGRPILDFYGKAESFAQFASYYNEWGAWIVFFAGVTPFPYKVITIASGATHLSFPVFMAASIAARGLVFFVISALLYWVGPRVRDFIERRLGLVTTVFMILLVGGFAALKYLW